MPTRPSDRLSVAVIGTGISGMAAAWLLSGSHDVTVYESADRIGGHSNTIALQTGNGTVPVDTGFIVYNEHTYPNFTALLQHLQVSTEASNMSFAVSLNDGELEYSGDNLATVFAQKRNIVSPRFWSMLRDLRRFYRDAPAHIVQLDDAGITLGDYLTAENYGSAFRDDHLLPMAAAIWSAPPDLMLHYPAGAFIRFYDNHGLLKLKNRPTWRTVAGGSRCYVERLTAPYRDRIRLKTPVVAIHRDANGIDIREQGGHTTRFDHVIVASHADQALALLADPTQRECELLSPFRYSRNLAVLHRDIAVMPKRRSVWSSWNYVNRRDNSEPRVGVTYWMNRLQNLPCELDLFVTLNPVDMPNPDAIFHSELYEHPLIDTAAIAAQRRLWSLQGQRRTWFCGSYFGAGFHEDGLQSALAVAETLGGVRRPWVVDNQSGRINLETERVAPTVEVAL